MDTCGQDASAHDSQISARLRRTLKLVISGHACLECRKMDRGAGEASVSLFNPKT
jgi:hypothetical protein